MGNELEVKEFIDEAHRWLQEKRESDVKAEMDRQIEIRKAWRKTLDKVRRQLPAVLGPFLTVHPDALDEAPYAGERKHRNIQLQVPRCTPIDLSFGCYSWTIELFWPREATGIWEEDDQIEVNSMTGAPYDNVYLAVAIANENYPAWKRLEEEVAWQHREAERIQAIAEWGILQEQSRQDTKSRIGKVRTGTVRIYPESDSMLEEVF